MRRKIGWKHATLRTRRAITGVGFLAPWLIGFLCFFLYPLFLSLQFSFCKLTLLTEGGYDLSWVGFENFRFALRGDPDFLPFLTESISEVLPNVAIILVFSLFVALLLKGKFHGSVLAKAIFFLPVIMSCGLFLDLQAGMDSTLQAGSNAVMEGSQQALSVLKSANLEEILLNAGFPEKVIEFITGPIDQIYSIMTNSGIQIFIFLAGLNSISPALYEAAQIESATPWEIFWKITFPMIMPMILVNAVYSIIDTFTSINNNVMDHVTNVFYDQREYGLSSAMSWIYFLCLGVILAVVGLIISRRIQTYN